MTRGPRAGARQIVVLREISECRSLKQKSTHGARAQCRGPLATGGSQPHIILMLRTCMCLRHHQCRVPAQVLALGQNHRRSSHHVDQQPRSHNANGQCHDSDRMSACYQAAYKAARNFCAGQKRQETLRHHMRSRIRKRHASKATLTRVMAP
jgi:hypothetical protein